MTNALPKAIVIAGVLLLAVGDETDVSRAQRKAAADVVLPGFLEQYAATRGFSLGSPRSVQVTPDADAVLFLRSGPRSFVQDLYRLKLTDALFRAGKNFEFLPLSNFTHMVPDPLVTDRLQSRILGFFQQHLGS